MRASYPRNWYAPSVLVSAAPGRSSPSSRDVMRFHLRTHPTLAAAKHAAVAWALDYERGGPPSVAATLRDCAQHWRDILPTRIAALDHLFCCAGNGYEWFDGALVATDPESHLELPPSPETTPLTDAEYAQRRDAVLTMAYTAEAQRLCLDMLERMRPLPPLVDGEYPPDDGAPHCFYDLGIGSTGREVPADARPDWIRAAIATTEAVRDRHVDREGHADSPEALRNRAAGAKRAERLRARFPEVSK